MKKKGIRVNSAKLIFHLFYNCFLSNKPIKLQFMNSEVENFLFKKALIYTALDPLII